MRMLFALAALMSMPALAAPVPAQVAKGIFMYRGARGVSPGYLDGRWDEAGPRACRTGYYVADYGGALTVDVDGEQMDYKIRGNRVYYEGVDGPTYDTIQPIDGNTMLFTVQNGKPTRLVRCRSAK